VPLISEIAGTSPAMTIDRIGSQVMDGLHPVLLTAS